ncbi:hypothetical protein [Streptomyces sp. NPDC001744]|uniref:hypothetical protein n=1 Tax=Streptomyces sp. NPDC001744 TaxID=3364606 RepID=UPI003678D598
MFVAQETRSAGQPVAPLPDLLPPVLDILEGLTARDSTDGRSVLHEVGILLDAVVVYQGPG